MSQRLYHGGVPGLQVGDLIEPGHGRKRPPRHRDRIYMTSDRLYAKHYAALLGPGDLYRVDPMGEVQRSTEDPIESFHAPVVRVAAVLDRAVRLTVSERRRLERAVRMRAPIAAESDSAPIPMDSMSTREAV